MDSAAAQEQGTQAKEHEQDSAGFGIMYPFFRLSNLIIPIRVKPEVELQGLDLPEMGALGYPDFELKTIASYSQTSDPRESLDVHRLS